jgi:cold shock protein
MATGRVIRFDEIKGYGFIAPNDGGEDVFVHANDLSERVRTGHHVEFRVVEGDRGLKAYDVRVIGDDPPRAVLPPDAEVPDLGNGHHPVTAESEARASVDEELFEIFAEREFVQQITELLLSAAPSASGATIVELRSALVQFARKNGWVE